jgi:transcriptional antiterminator NusG
LEWQILPDGKYKRIRTKVSNRFPGYVFINMVYDRDVWFTIRNTPGVLGFVGSSGKGAIPIPITIEEYAKIDKDNAQVAAPVDSIEPTIAPVVDATDVPSVITPIEEVKKVHITEAKVGQNVEILDGVFTGMVGEVKKLDNTNGSAIVALDIFGRSQEVEINYDQFKLAL